MNSTNTNQKEINLNKNNYLLAKWISCFFLLVSILIFLYTYYRAEITFQGTLDSRYFKYYILSLGGIAFWGVVIWLRTEIQANIVTVIIALIFGLYAIEGVLSIMGLGQTESRAAAAADQGIEFDQRTKLNVIEDLLSDGVDAVPTFHGSQLIELLGKNTEDTDYLLPLAGVSNKTTVYNNESGEYLIYKSDRYGFNNPDNQWNSKELEWLLTGDSFTHGSGVLSGQEIAAKIRSFDNSSVISLGIGGNGPLLEYATLIEYDNILVPENVVWLYFEGNDLNENVQNEKTIPLLMKYLEDDFSQNLIHRQKEIDFELETFIANEKDKAQVQQQPQLKLYRTRWLRLKAIRKLLDLDSTKSIKAESELEVNAEDPIFSEILSKTKARVESWGGKLYFVYLPQYERYSMKDISHDKFRNKNEVLNVIRGLDIKVIDIHEEVFANHADPLSLFPLRLEGHYNADGYEKVSMAIISKANEQEKNAK